MKPLTGRTGVQIKAALSIIHKAGLNVGGVERQAENAMRAGRGQVAAYEAAVGDFLRANPAVKPTVERIVKLISRSDDATVARYGAAIEAYVSGDEGPVNALAAMMRNDMQALMVRDGELSADDAAAGRVDWAALGVPGFAEPSGVPASAPTDGSEGQSASQRFSFADQPASPPTAPPAGNMRLQQPGAFSNQVGFTASPRREQFEARAERAAIGDAHVLTEAAPI